MDRIAAFLAQQHGVVSRRQVLACGLDDAFLTRSVRRRELTRVAEGMYVDHTGPLTWWQRAWVGLLYYAPAALSDESALYAERLRRGGADSGPIHIAIDHARRLGEIEGVRLHRKRDFERAVHPSRSPSRIRLEHALLDVASRAPSDDDAIALLADACQTGRTTAARLLLALEDRPRLPRRAMLIEMLADVASGAYSLLEHKYLVHVERPHGLPTAKRQRRVRPGRSAAYRDVEYLGRALVVELDGRLGHEESKDRWDDLDRDLDGIVGGDLTVRLGWRHVLEPCRVAAAIATILRTRGWSGDLVACSPTCQVAAPSDRRPAGVTDLPDRRPGSVALTR